MSSTPFPTAARKPAQWWGPLRTEHAGHAFWRVGPMRFWVEARPGEWRFSCIEGADPLETGIDHVRGLAAPEIDQDAHTTRFAAPEALALYVAPELADRPIVSTPEMGIVVPSGVKLVLYVSSPMWLSVNTDAGAGAGLADRDRLIDVPFFRPSDTWFGSTTVDGELAYASRTACRIQLADVLPRPHRCVTRAEVINEAQEPLLIERLKLPVPMLNIYSSSDGRFWSDDVTFTRRSADENAVITIGKGLPTAADASVLVSHPRTDRRDGLVIKAFSRLFS